jgi:hypothetical protein
VGPGVATGGTANQVLKKVDSTDYNTTWGTIAGAVYQDTAPSSPQTGDVWVDSDAVAGVLNQNDYLLKADAEAPSGYLLKTDGFVRTSSASSGEASTINVNTKPWNMPWGLVGYTTRGTSVSIGSNTETSTISVTFTAVSGRNYRVNYYEPVIQSGGGAYLQYKIRSDNTSGTIHQRADAEPVAYTSLDGQILDLKIIKQFTAGSNTLIGTVLPVSATAIAYANTSISCIAFISVEDMGPA